MASDANSNGVTADIEGAYLDLPDCPDFVSKPPELPLWANIKLMEEMLPIWNRHRFVQTEEIAQEITEQEVPAGILTVWSEEFYL